jgi:uncharacterized protein YggU (UPF0235/DUF167 family)
MLRVRVTPRSQADALETIVATAEGPALRARVRAVPEDGAANAALEKLVADCLGVPKTRVSVAAGMRGRIKTVAIVGDAGELAARLQAAFGR